MINIFKDFNLGDIVLPGSDLPTRNRNFVGREQYLEDIESAFFKEDKKIILISSFPGTGKTTLADKSENGFCKEWIVGSILNTQVCNKLISFLLLINYI